MGNITELGNNNNLPPYKMPVPIWLKGFGNEKKRVNIAGLGDVGQHVALALALTGGEEISRIGIFDVNSNQCARMEMELGQLRSPDARIRIPKTLILTEEELFDCEIFLFCATKTIPGLESGVSDVRMAQYEANLPLVSLYAKKAAERGFAGLFGVVSDPVDLLCQGALRASGDALRAKGSTLHAAGQADGGLNPYQIQGFGLGVMFARALYYADRQERFSVFQTEGRVFGPHGAMLIVADSILPEHYDDKRSQELTELVVTANQKVRSLGYKPYLAPACSSAALTLLAVIQGEWNESAQYLNGVYFGARNRTSPDGVEWETQELPQQLYRRLEKTYRYLEEHA